MSLAATLTLDEEDCALIECTGCMRVEPGARGWLAEVQVEGRSVFTGVLCRTCRARVLGEKSQ